MQRPDWDIYFMLQAEIAKLRSNCLTKHVGAVIVKDNRQIATGYNGTPSGIKNCFDGDALDVYPERREKLSLVKAWIDVYVLMQNLMR